MDLEEEIFDREVVLRNFICNYSKLILFLPLNLKNIPYMKRIIQNTFLAVALATVIVSGCTKTKDVIEDPTTNSPNTGNGTPTIKDGYGSFAAVHSVSFTTVQGITIPLDVNTAVSAFYSAPGSSSLVDAGTVTLNSKTLTKSSNNAYSYQNLTDPLSFNQVAWSVSGSSGVPAINYTDDRSFPDYSGYNSLPATLTKANGLTVSLGGTISNADSVYVIVSGGDKYVLKHMAGNASQCTFSASDLSIIGNTPFGMIQVAPWNYKKEDFNNKPYYFVLETVYTKQGVTIN
jgi:hypothetical protein